MTTMIACIVSVISVAAFIVLWFSVAYRELHEKYTEVMATVEQFRMHNSNYRQERVGPNTEAAKRMLDTSRMIYQESLHNYNSIYTRLFYRIPGLLMGFRSSKFIEDKLNS